MTTIGVPKAGFGTNNDMSLWTWPWPTSRVRRLRHRNQHPANIDSIRFYLARYGFVGFLALVFCFVATMPVYLPDVPKYNPQRKPGELSLAVLVAGSTQRFLFDSFTKHVVSAKAAAPSGNGDKGIVHIDYFAILTLKAGAAFRQGSGYMGHLKGRDEIFDGVLGTQQETSLDAIQAQMMDAMTRATKSTNTKIRALRLLAEPIEDDPILDPVRSREEKRFVENERKKGLQTKAARKKNPKDSGNNNNQEISFDFFQQFPMMDLREAAKTRTRAGNKNIVRLFLALESLWKNEFRRYEDQLQQPKHDYVLILRDDTLWLDDFDLHKVIATDPTADAYVLSCNGRQPEMLPPEINDHGILIRRDKANIVGEYVSAMASLDLQKCHDSVTEWLGKDRGCNSEMILKYILETNHVRVKLVPQSLLPFERAVRIDNSSNNNNNGNDFYCYHKFCQSIEDPLQLPSGMRKCKDLNFD